VRLIPLGVSVIVAALVFAGLGDAPFIDPPEGFHAVVAHTMSARGDFVTPRFDGVRSFDTPPLLYWLLSTAFALGGPTAAAARYWPALSGVAVAALTAATGVLIGGARVGLMAGLMVAANLGIFLHARLVEPDVLFIAFVTLAYAGFAAAYLGRGGRRGLAVFYAGLALAAITKDVVLAVGAVVAVGVFLFITRERPLGPWVPWWGIAVLAALPVAWYFAVERRNHGFVWYTVVDGHVLRYLHDRHFPDGHASVPTLDFLVATVVAFLPWSLAAPWAIARSFRRPWRTATDRLWVLFAVWALFVLIFFTVSPFKLAHDALPAFPALALLVARVWDDTLVAEPRALRSRTLLMPIFAVVGAAGIIATLAWRGAIDARAQPLRWLDAATRNLGPRAQELPHESLVLGSVLVSSSVIFGCAAIALAVAVWRGWTELGITAALGAMLALLPVAGRAMADSALARSTTPIVEALRLRLHGSDLLAHEGAIEQSASVVLALDRPITIVNGRVSTLAFGATFDEARDVFWDGARLRAAWAEPGRHFLVSVAAAERSVVTTLPRDSVHLLVASGGRRLYSNRGD